MAAITLSDVGRIFPSGTVYVYNAGSLPAIGSGEPEGSTVTSASVTSGSLSFTGLSAGSAYIAAASVGGTWKYLKFNVPSQSYSGSPTGFRNWQPVAATSGTDTTPVDGTVWVTSLIIPTTCTLTGISYLIGSVGGTDKAIVALYDSAGVVLANSATAGTTVGTAANVQALDFTAPYSVTSAGLYYASVSMNGTTARLRTVPAHTQAGVWSTSATGTFGTLAAITAPTTFTADKAPIVFTY